MEVGGQRRPTLSQHMTSLDSSNLRDLLRARDDEDGRHTLAGLTLAAVLSGENRRGPTRTLLDIIREEESGAAYRGLVPRHDQNNKKNWRSLKERLRIRRDGSNWPSSSSASNHRISVDECEIQISSPISSSRNTRNSIPIAPTRPSEGESPVLIQPENASEVDAAAAIVAEFRPPEQAVMRLSAALEAEREEQRQARESHVADEEEVALPVQAPAVEGSRVSLMALLEETDRQREAAPSPELALDSPEEEEGKGNVAEGVEEREGGGGGEVREYVCCVCMVRHKGAAFIPCGHTFCRLCSRELWVSRGNCPLCNGYILEILDIF